MIGTKYLIVVGVIICVLILYYFYDELHNMKKLIVPTYQKTMALENRILNIEKNKSYRCKNNTNTDSPALEITYRSDMINNNNLSAKYADLTDTEANELLDKLNKKSGNNQVKNDKYQETHDTMFDMELVDTIKKYAAHKQNDDIQYKKLINEINNDTMNIIALSSEQKNKQSIKAMSESIRMMDLPSENTLSEI